ncbi:hypothetical protein ACFQH6_20740 [Halobacteriaceae archaeon GCM10025711]
MELEASFERDLEAAVLEQAAHELVGKPNNVVYKAVKASHNRLDQSDYDTDPVKESFVKPEVERSGVG